MTNKKTTQQCDVTVKTKQTDDVTFWQGVGVVYIVISTVVVTGFILTKLFAFGTWLYGLQDYIDRGNYLQDARVTCEIQGLHAIYSLGEVYCESEKSFGFYFTSDGIASSNSTTTK